MMLLVLRSSTRRLPFALSTFGSSTVTSTFPLPTSSTSPSPTKTSFPSTLRPLLSPPTSRCFSSKSRSVTKSIQELAGRDPSLFLQQVDLKFDSFDAINLSAAWSCLGKLPKCHVLADKHLLSFLRKTASFLGNGHSSLEPRGVSSAFYYIAKLGVSKEDALESGVPKQVNRLRGSSVKLGTRKVSRTRLGRSPNSALTPRSSSRLWRASRRG